ncbi:unnamed protein product [Rotaria sp. Silwood1]|nr:unnamed protein product [Rotaria sp. Silwood1]
MFALTPFSFHIDPSSLSNINNFQENYDQSSNQFRLDKSEKPSTTDNSVLLLVSTTNSSVLLSPTTRKKNLLSLSTTSAKKIHSSKASHPLKEDELVSTTINKRSCQKKCFTDYPWLTFCKIFSTKWFSLICDETCNESTTEQLCIIISSVDSNCKIFEDVVGLYGISAQNVLTIVEAICDVITPCGLDIINGRDQSYDEASNMPGIYGGVSTIILNQYSKAIYIYCVAHCLDLVVHDLTDQCASISNCIFCVKDIIDFIRRSPKRLIILKEILYQILLSYTNLTALCSTRWTLRAESYGSLLKTYEQGPTPFEALRTVNGQICATFREACQLHGLLEDDQQWDATMSEAAAAQSPVRLRNLFALILAVCGPSNPKQLWESYKESLIEDILRNAGRQNPGMNLDYTPDMFNEALIIIENKVLEMGGKELEKLKLSTPQRNSANEPLLVPDQRAAYNAILDQIEKKAGGIIFLDAPGGTGKTFVINLLLAKIRHQSKIAIAVASSGIAATLLHGGRTAHSTLKLPLKFLENQTHVCSITKGTGEAKVLQECELIVWDECTMAHRYALEALNHTLQDLRNNGKNMGGVVVLIAGDFRQTLPVIPKGTMADELKACLKSSYLWRHVVPLKLSTNMRVHLQGDVSAGRFAEQLLAIGNGKIPADPVSGLINISDNFCNIVESVEELKNKVFPNIQTQYKDHKWLCERAILAPKNVNVNAINLQIQQQLPGEAISYKSIDTVKDIDMVVQYPTEFLNSLEPSGMPPHNLRLKIGSSIMLLRNLDAPRLCNGIRLCLKTLMPHVIEATIMTGCAKGEDVFIPKIPLLPSDIPFEFTRLQFPVRLAFAMSINNAQGQSFKGKVTIRNGWLRKPSKKQGFRNNVKCINHKKQGFRIDF